RAADDIAGDIAAGAAGAEADALELGENGGDVLDAQPVELDGHAGGDVGETVTETLGDFADLGRLDGVELAAGDAQAHHEKARILRLLPVDAVPLHAVEIAGIDRGEARLRVAIDVVDDVEAVFIQLHLLLRGEGDEALLDGGVVGLDIDHRVKRRGANLGGGGAMARHLSRV